MRSNVKRGSIFTTVKANKIPQSRHNMSYVNKLTFNMGEAIPFYCEDVVPGSKFDIKAAFFGRMMPMVAPILETNLDLEMRFFFVPKRILWEDYEEYVTHVGDHVYPYREVDQKDKSKLLDCLCMEPVTNLSSGNAYLVDALKLRAYAMIYNEYYRDQNLQTELPMSLAEGKDTTTNESIFNVGWRKDYFTSALPWTQRGNMAQMVGDVFLKSVLPGNQLLVDEDGVEIDNIHATGNITGDYSINQIVGNDGAMQIQGLNVDPGTGTNYRAGEDVFLDPNGTMGVSFPISQLRYANAVQRYLERSAVAGNRYAEWLMAMYGVKCADSRLQRPEYLGGGRVPINIIEVLQNEQAQLDANGDIIDNSTPQGNVAGIGKMEGLIGINKPYFFPEEGYIIGLCYVRPETVYCQGIRKQNIVGVKRSNVSNFRDAFDMIPNHLFEHIGEDGVQYFELYADDNALSDYNKVLNGSGDVFGYQSRYANYKYHANEIHGEFKNTLSYWHLTRMFANKPTLNSSFIKCTPSDRIWAVSDIEGDDKIMLEVHNIVDAILPFSPYSEPAL